MAGPGASRGSGSRTSSRYRRRILHSWPMQAFGFCPLRIHNSGVRKSDFPIQQPKRDRGAEECHYGCRQDNFCATFHVSITARVGGFGHTTRRRAEWRGGSGVFSSLTSRKGDGDGASHEVSVFFGGVGSETLGHALQVVLPDSLFALRYCARTGHVGCGGWSFNKRSHGSRQKIQRPCRGRPQTCASKGLTKHRRATGVASCDSDLVKPWSCCQYGLGEQSSSQKQHHRNLPEDH